jgi:hypothetical protein
VACRLASPAVRDLDLRVKRDEVTRRMLYGVAKFDEKNPVSGTYAEEIPEAMLRGHYEGARQAAEDNT